MRSRAEKLRYPVLIGAALLGWALPGEARDRSPPPPATGPAADYPIVLGAPFTVNGVTYTPADKLNFDQVGYAEIDPAGGAGVSVAHRTLPLPSYAEVTSLRTGRTILVRVERRGPMTGDATITLSPGAAAQLGAGDPRTPIRIRRVNPAEPERALLRGGERAPARMDTPMSLVAVLLRKLEPAALVPPVAAPAAAPVAPPAAPPRTAAGPAAPAAPGPKRPAVMPAVQKPAPADPAATARPEPRLAAKPEPKPESKPEPKPQPRPAAVAARPAVSARLPAGGQGTVIQVGAYSSRAAAAAVAGRTGGVVSPAGKLFRVRLGGFATTAQASAALAKVRAAGYSDARIQHAD